jgi:Mg-chelatase subunit ChlD
MQPLTRIHCAPAQTLIFVFFIALACANNTAHAKADSVGGGVLFILDGSGSMWGRVEGKEKIVIAREVMGELVTELPDEIQVGLMAYGHRSKGECEDIELLVPVGASSKTDVVDKINGIMPKGKTPITESFELAGERLKDREDETTVVLISDGEETCGGDPCARVRDLRQQGINVRVHVVGFDVSQAEREQLMCIAEAGDGKYFSADNADQLKKALTEVRQEVVTLGEVKKTGVEKPSERVVSVKPPTPGSVTFRNLYHKHKGIIGAKIYDTDTGKGVATCAGSCAKKEVPVKLAPGTYKIIVKGGATVELGAFEVSNGEDIVVDLNTLVGFIIVRNAPGYFQIRKAEAETGKPVGSSCSGNDCRPIPALPGTYRLELKDKAYAGYETNGFEVKAGEEVVVDLGGN